jgi:hypothetical protein
MIVFLLTSPNEYFPIIHGRVMYHSFNPVMYAHQTVMVHLTMEGCNHIVGFAVVLMNLDNAGMGLAR